MPVQHHLQTRYGGIRGSKLNETVDSVVVSLLTWGERRAQGGDRSCLRLLFIIDPLGPSHCSNSPAHITQNLHWRQTPMCLSWNTPKSKWLEKESPNVSDSGPDAYTGILDETLDMKRAKATQFEIALYFLLLGSLPTNRPTSQVLKRMS